MKIIATLIIAASLTGCSTIMEYVPSFWDDNQSQQIVTVRQMVHRIDCNQDQRPQAVELEKGIQWFQLYSESKGSLQKDVIRLVGPMHETSKDWLTRTEKGSSRAYCEIKRKILIEQADRAAEAVLGRF